MISEMQFPTKKVQKFGGFAALYLAASYLAGILLFLVVLDYASITDPAQKVALIVEKQGIIYLTNLLMYVFFGFFLVLMTLAVRDRIKSAAPALVRGATATGLIWAGALIASGIVSNLGISPAVQLYASDPAQAASAWAATETVANLLGGANGEILGGIFTLLVSLAGLRVSGLPKGLNILGLLVGVVGILSTVPGLSALTGLFGLTQIAWFVWIGLVLLRRPSAA